METITLILIIFIICEIFWTEVVNYRVNQIEEKVKELKILIETKDKSYNQFKNAIEQYCWGDDLK